MRILLKKTQEEKVNEFVSRIPPYWFAQFGGLVLIACVIAGMLTASAMPRQVIERATLVVGTADPVARVFNGKLYIYTSLDEPADCLPPRNFEGFNNFCMPNYRIFMTEGAQLRPRNIREVDRNILRHNQRPRGHRN